MTRKHFEAIADALFASRTCWGEHPADDYPDNLDPGDPEASYCPEQEQWWRTVEHVGDAMSAFNGGFDRSRFERRCIEGPKR